MVIREQTEGEYSALEHESIKGVVECLKVVTKVKSRKIAKFAFDYATKHGRKKVNFRLVRSLFLNLKRLIIALKRVTRRGIQN